MTEHHDLAGLPAAEQRARAREIARNDPAITGAQLGAMFERGERWGRNQLAATRNGTGAVPARRNGTAVRHAGGPVTSVPARASDTDRHPAPVPAQPASAPAVGDRHSEPGTGRHGNVERAGWVDRAVVTATVVALAIVSLAPMAVSFQSLAGWGHEALGLDAPWTYIVPLTLDAAALACVGLTFHAMSRAESAGAARLLVWLFAGASAVANWRHGTAIGPDAAVYYPTMPLVAALLLDMSLRYVRRTALAGIGALERPLPRYRAARWIVAPIETWRAWRHAVRHGITNPRAAIDAIRRHTNGTAAQTTQTLGEAHGFEVVGVAALAPLGHGPDRAGNGERAPTALP